MPDAGAARRAAAQILSGPQFHARPGKSFDPFNGVLAAIGRAVGHVTGPVGRVLGRAFDAVAGVIGTAGALVVVLAVVAGVVAVVAVAVVRHRARLGPEPAPAGLAAGPITPEELERRADTAEAAGDLELAVRLRFRAGLARLEQLGIAGGAATRTSRELATLLGSGSFEQLATDLEAILYAEAPADPGQAAAARELWPKVLEEAGRRG